MSTTGPRGSGCARDGVQPIERPEQHHHSAGDIIQFLPELGSRHDKDLVQASPSTGCGDGRRASRLSRPGLAGENGWAAVGMTQQYLAGELSVLLARLQAVATNQASARDAAHLRREAETSPLTALASVVVRALDLSDSLCWDSLQQGDAAAFSCQAAVCAELCDFGVCAGFLEEGYLI